MTDPALYMTIAGSGLAGLTIVTCAGLAGWRGWLQLQAERMRAGREAPTAAGAGARIEIADLKERLRKLEAIAAGVDL